MLQRLHLVATLLLLLAVVGLAWSNVAFRREALAQARHQRAEAEARLQEYMARQKARGDPLRIQTGDKLELIDFHGALHTIETVAGDGKILVPEVGWVAVAGLTREEAEALLTKTLAAYFLDPDIKVKVVENEKARVLERVKFDEF
jgi:protein involved in polysaccharide export with SLBB domain